MKKTLLNLVSVGAVCGSAAMIARALAAGNSDAATGWAVALLWTLVGLLHRADRRACPFEVIIYLDENGRPCGSVQSYGAIVDFRSGRDFGGIVSDAAKIAKKGGAE